VFRRFVQSRPGRALIPLIAVAVVFATYVYVSTLLAIPAILVFGLAIPIWGGLKRPRYLALTGLVVVLLVAPIATVAITQEIRTPVAPSSSITTTSSTAANGSGPVLLNAQVTPYTGDTSTLYNWSLTLQPQYLPAPGGVLGISLYLSTCPGATSGNDTVCAAGYPFYNYTHNFTPALTTKTPYAFTQTISTAGIYDWQMCVFFRNATSGNLSYLFLVGDPTYNGIEGPVVGSWFDTFSELLPTVYLNGLLLLALPFFFVLLLYVYFKRREIRKQDQARRIAGPPPPDGGTGTAPGPPGTLPPSPPAAGAAAATSGVEERACPNCGAVVYANETTCWKCGTSLSGGGAGAPLPSSK